jgi:hypothetical protein
MSKATDYEILFELNTSPYKETSSWVLPNIFNESFPKKTTVEFVIDDILKKPQFKLDGQFPQYK